MRKITITLDEETARWAHIEAARLGTSVSLLVGGILKEHMRSMETYERARRPYSNRSPTVLKVGEGSYPSRSEIHPRCQCSLKREGPVRCPGRNRAGATGLSNESGSIRLWAAMEEGHIGPRMGIIAHLPAATPRDHHSRRVRA